MTECSRRMVAYHYMKHVAKKEPLKVPQGRELTKLSGQLRVHSRFIVEACCHLNDPKPEPDPGTILRAGKVALLFMQRGVRQRGMEINSAFARKVKTIAREIHIPKEEALEFAREMAIQAMHAHLR